MATTFTCFSLLPTEIRLQIWRTAQLPQIVRIQIDPDVRVPERPLDAFPNWQARSSRKTRPFFFRSTVPLPPTLAVNHESREELLGLYTLVCDDSGPRFYYNMNTDTLWIDQHEYGDDWAMLVERITDPRWTGASYPSRRPTKVHSIAIRGDNFHHTMQSPNFAVLVQNSGVQEVFLIAEGRDSLPRIVWPVVDDTQFFPSLITFLQNGHDVLAQQLRELEHEGGFAEGIPVVTALGRRYWDKNGLQLVCQARHSVVFKRQLSLC